MVLTKSKDHGATPAINKQNPPIQQPDVSNKDVDIEEGHLWTPTFETALSLFLLPRLVSAFVNPIADCDEVFNYWEPLHYLIYQFGFQTWEYSPLYALRSYFYLVLHKILVSITSWGLYIGLMMESFPKVVLFYGMRGMFALISSYCEAMFYRASIPHFGRRTARYLLWFLLWNTGMFHASTAFLPSTSTMYLMMLVMIAWMERQTYVAIFYGVVAVVSGWPYVGVLFLPFFVETVATCSSLRNLLAIFLVGMSMGIGVVAIEVGVNYYYYQRLVLPAWNIVQYNVLSTETDSSLYGTEPASFYVLNLFLNFNIASILALPAGVVVAWLRCRPNSPSSRRRRFLLLLPLYLWLVIMFTQDHKEERFLFPVYPLLCLAAACTLSTFISWVESKSTLVHALLYTTLGMYSLISVSRTMSTVLNYSAPLRVYQHLHDHILQPNAIVPNKTNMVCIGKEWYRFPSSFFIPTRTTSIRFLQTGFHGLLPHPFATENGTSMIPMYMNNENREEPTLYVQENDCDYVIDWVVSETSETKYWEKKEQWQMLYSELFMDASSSPSPYRSFYIPYLTSHKTTFTPYAIYKNKYKTTIKR